jgi:RimJ/RimL family protein N-acetyltransferase
MASERRRGEIVSDWRAPPPPARRAIAGRYVRLEPLDPAHAAALHAAGADDDAIWDYLPYGPFTAAEHANWVAGAAASDDPLFLALVDPATGQPGGVAALMRITPEAGTIEVGHIRLMAPLRRSRAASEAVFLLAETVFALGYRRFEWKCDALNLPSRRAAERFGFSHEGVFRQHMVVKGRNRDTAWFAMTDRDWTGLRAAFRHWLDPANFDGSGRQRQPLGPLTTPHRAASDPALRG